MDDKFKWMAIKYSWNLFCIVCYRNICVYVLYKEIFSISGNCNKNEQNEIVYPIGADILQKEKIGDYIFLHMM